MSVRENSYAEIAVECLADAEKSVNAANRTHFIAAAQVWATLEAAAATDRLTDATRFRSH